MTEESGSFWDKIFSRPHHFERERKVLEYINYRIGEGAHLRDVVQEEYVRRHASQAELDEILDNPRLVETAHEKMREEFSSGELDPR
jgi:hypothetical protein